MLPNSTISQYGSDILFSCGMQSTKDYMQHGNTSVFQHSLNVAVISLYIAKKLKLNINKRAIVRGALLHDYFMYDWHIKDSSHKWHAFTHAQCAMENASQDFTLTDIERDIISKHMFPLNISLPGYKESVIVCIADKICAVLESLYISINI